MRWLVMILALTAVVSLSACGSRKDSSAESESTEAADGIVQADTANIDTSGSAETLPTIDTGDNKPAEDAPKPETAKSEENAEAPKEQADAAPAESTPTPSLETPKQAEPTPVAGSGKIANYNVQKGDTLMKIAFNVYGDIDQWKNIYELNKDTLQNANVLTVGTSLKYDRPSSEPNIQKNGEPYLIKSGDTLGTIADDVYAKRSKWKKIYENNRGLIKDPNRIYAGFYLYYQITEEEKREAEEIRARRGNQMGSTEKLPDSAANTPNPGNDAVKAGGLNNLAAPAADRAPASK